MAGGWRGGRVRERGLAVLLGPRRVGTILRLPGERSLFVFDDAYAADAERPVLSQSFLSAAGTLRQDASPTQGKLPPWFSNLLPEGRLREYLARRARVHPALEYDLLRVVGEDLPGAVRVLGDWEDGEHRHEPPGSVPVADDAPLRFSLAGVQLKFSALMNRQGGLTIPASGMGGTWIVKLPSPEYPAVPENEAAMLTLAGSVGIQVPEHRLVSVDAIEGLPALGPFAGKQALAVRRFDRTETGRVHMEDLAQVFGVYPESKYRGIGVARIAELIGVVLGHEAAQDFVARLAFIVLTGNGDMHLKNWSLLYPDGHTPVLAPAYDLVSTVPYMPGETLALSFVNERSFAAITVDRFRQLAARAGLSERGTVATAERVASAVRGTWAVQRRASNVPAELLDRIEAHLAAMPLGR